MIAVLVPTYRRAPDLVRCLQAIALQTRRAEQVVVITRQNDDESAAVLPEFRDRLPLKNVTVKTTGLVHALNAGLAQCTGDIVAITDDDAAPRPDWLARIEAHFARDPKTGGVGGRDWVHQNGVTHTAMRRQTGTVQWYGRIIGNHHLGAGPPREVDILKGANCAFRMSAIAPIGFDARLRGTGAQVHNDMLVSLAIKRAGWRLIYDPEVAVDHYPAPRFDIDLRDQFNPQATADRAYNTRLSLAEITPAWRRRAATTWHNLIGTPDEPGLLNLLRMLAKREPHALEKFRAAHGTLARPS